MDAVSPYGPPLELFDSMESFIRRVKSECFARKSKFRLQIDLFNAFMNDLAATVQGNGRSLLDDTLGILTSDMSNGQWHFAHYVPVFFSGGASGRVESAGLGGRRIKCDKSPQVELANVWRSTLRLLGLPNDQIGMSDGYVF